MPVHSSTQNESQTTIGTWNMAHVMLDLETWGESAGCDIRSIGAVEFDPYTGDIGRQFYTATEGGLRYALRREADTVAWWAEQSAESQAAFTDPIGIREACFAFGIWLQQFDDLNLWANDPHFDVAILEAVYRAVGLTVPWHYRAPRSMKTACMLARMTRDDYAKHGVEHHALHDAIAQAVTISRAYRKLGLTRDS